MIPADQLDAGCYEEKESLMNKDLNMRTIRRNEAQVTRDTMHDLGEWDEKDVWAGLPVMKVCNCETPRHGMR